MSETPSVQAQVQEIIQQARRAHSRMLDLTGYLSGCELEQMLSDKSAATF